MNWLGISTHLDMAPVVSLLSSYLSKPSSGHLDAIKYAGQYLKATAHYGLVYSSNCKDHVEAYVNFPLDSLIQLTADDGTLLPSLQGFADANWGPQDASVPTPHNMCKISPVEIRSVCGHLLFLCGALILWKSQKELRNSHSSCESEIKATDECTKNMWYIRNILEDLSLLDINTPTTIYNDNRGAVDWANTMH